MLELVLLMHPLDFYFPVPLYSELRAWIALVALFDQGPSNVRVNTVSKYFPSHPVGYPIDMQWK